jgi:hypothetical protein
VPAQASPDVELLSNAVADQKCAADCRSQCRRRYWSPRPQQVGDGDWHDDLLAQADVELASKVDRVFGDVGMVLQGARGRAMSAVLFFAPIPRRKT